MTVYDLSALPSVSLAGMVKGTDYVTPIGRRPLRVRLVINTVDGAASVSVRPYQRFEGRWFALRADGVAGVGVEPVTAKRGVYNNTAEGLFLATMSAEPVILVAESGDPANLIAAYLLFQDIDG